MRRIGRFANAHVAFWHIARFLAAHPFYRNIPLANMRAIQQSIALGKYFCLSDGKTVQAVASWRDINVETFRRTYPTRYVALDSETLDGVFLTGIAGVDQASLKIMVSHIKKTFPDKDIYWDRHKGTLGHRSRRTSARVRGGPWAALPCE